MINDQLQHQHDENCKRNAKSLFKYIQHISGGMVSSKVSWNLFSGCISRDVVSALTTTDIVLPHQIARDHNIVFCYKDNSKIDGKNTGFTVFKTRYLMPIIEINEYSACLVNTLGYILFINISNMECTSTFILLNAFGIISKTKSCSSSR